LMPWMKINPFRLASFSRLVTTGYFYKAVWNYPVFRKKKANSQPLQFPKGTCTTL
jgi:hypothetical protein